jgi:hypothetical protein
VSRQLDSRHRSCHLLRSVLQRTSRTRVRRKWTELERCADIGHGGSVVGGRVAAGEACVQTRVEAAAVLISVGVATTRTRAPRAGEEAGSPGRAIRWR